MRDGAPGRLRWVSVQLVLLAQIMTDLRVMRRRPPPYPPQALLWAWSLPKVLPPSPLPHAVRTPALPPWQRKTDRQKPLYRRLLASKCRRNCKGSSHHFATPSIKMDQNYQRMLKPLGNSYLHSSTLWPHSWLTDYSGRREWIELEATTWAKWPRSPLSIMQ